MNSLKIILVGFIVGGAFGAKIGAFLNMLGEAKLANWASIELGFLLGAGLGLMVSFAVLFVKSGVFEGRESGVAQSELSTNTI